jgi:hypothetical protein
VKVFVCICSHASHTYASVRALLVVCNMLSHPRVFPCPLYLAPEFVLHADDEDEDEDDGDDDEDGLDEPQDDEDATAHAKPGAAMCPTTATPIHMQIQPPTLAPAVTAAASTMHQSDGPGPVPVTLTASSLLSISGRHDDQIAGTAAGVESTTAAMSSFASSPALASAEHNTVDASLGDDFLLELDEMDDFINELHGHAHMHASDPPKQESLNSSA